MHNWIAPSEKAVATDTLENRLWGAADRLRANSGLTSQQYSQLVLGAPPLPPRPTAQLQRQLPQDSTFYSALNAEDSFES